MSPTPRWAPCRARSEAAVQSAFVSSPGRLDSPPGSEEFEVGDDALQLLDLLLGLVGGGRAAADGDDLPEVLAADVEEHDGREQVDARLVAVHVLPVLDAVPALGRHRLGEAPVHVANALRGRRQL